MTLLLQLPLSLHSLFSPSLSTCSHSLFFFLSSETYSLARTATFLSPCSSPLVFVLRNTWGRSLIGSLERGTLLSELLCRPFRRKHMQPQKLIFSWARNFALQGNKEVHDSKGFGQAPAIKKIETVSCTPYPVPGRRLVTMPQVGNVPAYHKHQHSRGCRKVNFGWENEDSLVRIPGHWKRLYYTRMHGLVSLLSCCCTNREQLATYECLEVHSHMLKVTARLDSLCFFWIAIWRRVWDQSLRKRREEENYRIDCRKGEHGDEDFLGNSKAQVIS